jgi:hypothetical protein
MSTRDAYLKELLVQLDELNAELDRLNTESKKEGTAAAGVQFEQRIEELRQKRHALRQRAAKVEETGEGGWEELKEGLEKTWEGLKSGLMEAKAEFQRGYRAGMEEDPKEDTATTGKEPK